MLLAILAVWFGYKKARDSGRNAVLWAVICGAAFVGIQLFVGVACMVILALGVAAAGWDEGIYDKYTWLINLIGIGASIIAILLIFRYLDKIRETETVNAPPPPPTFAGDHTQQQP